MKTGRRWLLVFIAVAALAQSGTIQDSLNELNATIDRIKAEHAAYKAIAEGDGRHVDIYKKNGVWWVKATKEGHTVDSVLYDRDRTVKGEPDGARAWAGKAGR